MFRYFLTLAVLTIAAGLVGLTWGLIRIESILIVPYFYLAVYVLDPVVYVLLGCEIGRRRGASQHRSIGSLLMLLPLAAAYVSDRFLSARIILDIPFAGSTQPEWSLVFETLIIGLAIVSLWRSWQLVRPPNAGSHPANRMSKPLH